jgi:DNA-binding CsgD family transcriptional regulator
MIKAVTQAALLLTPQLSHWLDELYVQAKKQPLHDFKHWCFGSLQPLLRFDSALWGTRSDLLELRREHWVDDMCVFNQPDEFMANYVALEQQANTTDPLNVYLYHHPGQFYSIWDCCDKAIWYQSDYYLKHSKLFGVENAISALVLPSENSVVSHVFSFFRADASDEFSADETLLANFILPNLIEAFRVNLLSSFGQTSDTGGSFRAVLDRYGAILEAENGFYQLMQDQGLMANTKVSIPGLEEMNTSAQLKVQDLQLITVFDDGLLYIEAKEGSLLAKLSEREYQVLELLSTGITTKEIAEFLSTDNPKQPIKANTVNTHLTAIYKKLKVTDKNAATAVFLTEAKHS